MHLIGVYLSYSQRKDQDDFHGTIGFGEAGRTTQVNKKGDHGLEGRIFTGRCLEKK